MSSAATATASPRTSAAMGRRAAPALRRALPMTVLPALALALWEIGVLLGRPAPWLLPAPHDIGHTLVVEHDRLWFHAQATIQTAVVGLALAAAAGLALAAAISASRVVEGTVYPWIIASQTVPVLAVAPLLGIWVGYGTAQLLVVTVFCFFPVVVTGVDSLRTERTDLTAAARSLGAGPWDVWRRIALPAALPSLFSGLRLAAVFAVTGAVVAEYVGADRGLGFLTELATAQFETVLTFAAVVWLAVLGIAAFGLISLVERLVMPWRFRPTRRRHG